MIVSLGGDGGAMPTFWKPPALPVTEVFIQMGMQRGNSLAAALAAGCPECRSVEYTDLFYEFARERFVNEPRVRLFHGSSPDVLPAMIDPGKSTTFWLDAHFSGSDRAWQDPKYGECPLLKELEIIAAAPWKVPPVICIDDAFIFRESTWDGPSWVFQPELFTRSHWPLLADIQRMIPDFDLVEDNYVLFCTKRVL
jgi:hypothetical protein